MMRRQFVDSVVLPTFLLWEQFISLGNIPKPSFLVHVRIKVNQTSGYMTQACPTSCLILLEKVTDYFLGS